MKRHLRSDFDEQVKASHLDHQVRVNKEVKLMTHSENIDINFCPSEDHEQFDPAQPTFRSRTIPLKKESSLKSQESQVSKPVLKPPKSKVSAIAEDDMKLTLLKKDSRRNSFRSPSTPRVSSKSSEEGLNLAIIDALNTPEIQRDLKNEETIELLEFAALKSGIFPNKKPLDLNDKNGLAVHHILGSPAEKEKIPPSKRRFSIGGSQNIKKIIEAKAGTSPKADKKSQSRSERFKLDSKNQTSMSLFFSVPELKQRLNNYVPIAIFLAELYDNSALSKKILFYDNKLMDETGLKNTKLDSLLQNSRFLLALVENCVLYDEKTVFKQMLNHIVSWDILFRDEFLEAMFSTLKIDYLAAFLNSFNSHLKQTCSTSKKSRNSRNSGFNFFPTASNIAIAEDSNHPKSPKEGHPGLSKPKMVAILKKYFDHFNKNSLILEILFNLNYNEKEIVEMLLLTGEEDKILAVINENHVLRKFVNPQQVVGMKLYKLLEVFSSRALIEIFNMQQGDSLKKPRSLFQELCYHIKSGEKLQSLCFTIMNVHIVFWDIKKFWEFFHCVNSIFRDEGKDFWLAHVGNPLLFFVRLSYFFQELSKALMLESKDVDRLREDIDQFCIKYLQRCSEDILSVNILDKDSQGLSFLDYCFLSKREAIVSHEFVVRKITKMWSSAGKTKKSLKEFFRVHNFSKLNTEFSFQSLLKSYKVPVTRSEIFHVDYYQTVNSVNKTVFSMIVWLLVQVGMEFSLSMILIHLHRNLRLYNESHWLIDIYRSYPKFLITFAYLRLSLMVSSLVRLFVLHSDVEVGNNLRFFCWAQLLLSILQLTLPRVYGYEQDKFWMINILQVLITSLLGWHCYYLGLSLQWFGVVLRIFFRMMTVVVYFGLASFLIILCVAYPIHAIFVDFSQLTHEGNQLNLFHDLYTGVLTLFEFTFGAVIFVRPYLEENGYTYSMSAIMVIFSFFGNIMMANLLVAFLANQFTRISNLAKYYTLKLQYGLTKVLRSPDLDSLHALPDWLFPICMPFILCLIKSGPCRRRSNRLLRKLTHIVNSVFPWGIFYFCYLSFQVVLTYLEFIGNSLAQISNSFSNIVLLLVWMIFGWLYLLVLACKDYGLVITRVFNMAYEKERDDLNPKFKDHQRKRFCKIFQIILEVAKKMLNEKKLRLINVNQLTYEITRHSSIDHKSPTFSDENEIEVSGEEEETLKRLTTIKNYKTDTSETIRGLLQRFVNMEDKITAEGVSQQQIDLMFLIAKIKANLTTDRVHLLVAFNKESLESARAEMLEDEGAETRNDLAEIKTRIDNMGQDISALMKSMARIEAKLN